MTRPGPRMVKKIIPQRKRDYNYNVTIYGDTYLERLQLQIQIRFSSLLATSTLQGKCEKQEKGEDQLWQYWAKFSSGLFFQNFPFPVGVSNKNSQNLFPFLNRTI